jgi:hypothetical protein
MILLNCGVIRLTSCIEVHSIGFWNQQLYFTQKMGTINPKDFECEILCALSFRARYHRKTADRPPILAWSCLKALKIHDHLLDIDFL